jgi:putative transposase
MKVSASHISNALSMYYKGLSFRDIADLMQQEHDYRPSKSVIYDWINKYTDMAIDHFKDYRPHVGNTWIADETVLDLDNHKVWFWDIIDADTRFLLASRVSLSRRTIDAERLMADAAKRAGKAPKIVITDKLRSYLDGIEVTFGADTEHKQSSPFALGDSTSLIERFHGTLKDRTKVMRGFKDIDTLLQFTDGFLVYYNFLRPHEGLDGSRTGLMSADSQYQRLTTT